MDKIKVADYEEVLATVKKYTDACKEGKSEKVKRLWIRSIAYADVSMEHQWCF